MAVTRKDQAEQGMGVLEMKLGACLTAPTKRAIADLHHLAYRANVVRNGITRFWIRWREDNPEWQPEQRRDRKGKPKVALMIEPAPGYSKNKIHTLIKAKEAIVRPDGVILHGEKEIGKKVEKPVIEHPAFSQDLENMMYTKGTELAPDMACALVAQLRGEIVDRLKMRLPYNHSRETGGKCKFRWEAILANEVASDTYRSIHIPAPNNSTIVGYEGYLSRAISPGVDANVKKMCHSSAVVRLQLFSRESGREVGAHIFRIEARQFPRGKRAILRRIATGEWKLCDSKLVYKRDKWFFQMTYLQPQKSLNLNPKSAATLIMSPHTQRQPMFIQFQHETNRVSRWELGDGVPLLAEYARLLLRRTVMQNRYNTASPGRKGHGKQRAFRAMKPLTRRANDLMDAFTNNMVTSIIKFCIRYDCGTITYREPSLMLRDFSWFAKKGEKAMPYNWTNLFNKLKHKCWLNGIDLQVIRMGCKEHRELFGDATPGVPETPEQIAANPKEEFKKAV